MKPCVTCGVEIAQSASICPHCGAKQPPPVVKKGNVTSKWWFWVIIGVVVLIIIAPKGGNSTESPDATSGSGTTQPSSATTATTKPTATPKPTPTPVEYIDVTATELSNAYLNNEVAADKAYKGQMLSITGVVDDISVTLGITHVVLLNDDDRWTIVGRVNCAIDKSSVDAVAEINKGDTVTLRGKCSGKSMQITLDKCELITD